MVQVLPCEFCEISKNSCITDHLWTTASVKRPHDFTEAATGYVLQKKVLLKISQTLQENTCRSSGL